MHESVQTRMEICDQLLNDPARLQSLQKTGLMDSGRDPAYDRLSELAARILKVPLTIISLVSDQKQFFKSGYGLPAPFDETRQIPIDDSICRYTLSGQEIVSANALEHDLLMSHPTTKPWGIVAFIAIPMITREGHVLGAFCAVDTKVREWSEDDLFLMRELTASVMTEVYLGTQIEELKKQRDIREQFVTTLSHDLRTPLSVVKMASEMMLDQDTDPQDRSQMVRMIQENIERADQMIRDLLDSSRIKVGETVHLVLEDCDLHQIANSTIESLASVTAAQLHLLSAGALPGRWDPMALRRIIENLVGNAVKYGDCDKAISVRLELVGDYAQIQVHNDGNPISESALPNLFEPFHRSSEATQGAQKGWGIGLTLVRGFAEAHGGNVIATSNPVDGTTFTVRLPRNSEN